MLGNEELRYISLFQSLTGATVRDCVIDEEYNRLIFVVKPEEVGLAIGRRGFKIQQLSKFLNRRVEVVAYSDKPEELIRNSLAPARVKSVQIMRNPRGELVAYVRVEPADKRIAIGAKGRNINRARILSKRYFDIDRVVIL